MVALHVLVDAIALLAGVLGVDRLDALAQLQDLAGVDLDVSRLALEPAARLVDEDAAVREREPLALGSPASSIEPADIAIPKQIVCTSDWTNCIVS